MSLPTDIKNISEEWEKDVSMKKVLVRKGLNVIQLLMSMIEQWVYKHIKVRVNLRNQILSGIPNPFKESGESLKCIEIPRNL